jgi:hypothetical protein
MGTPVATHCQSCNSRRPPGYSGQPCRVLLKALLLVLALHAFTKSGACKAHLPPTCNPLLLHGAG